MNFPPKSNVLPRFPFRFLSCRPLFVSFSLTSAGLIHHLGNRLLPLVKAEGLEVYWYSMLCDLPDGHPDGCLRNSLCSTCSDGRGKEAALCARGTDLTLHTGWRKTFCHPQRAVLPEGLCLGESLILKTVVWTEEQHSQIKVKSPSELVFLSKFFICDNMEN